jgi:hypothetical protein
MAPLGPGCLGGRRFRDVCPLCRDLARLLFGIARSLSCRALYKGTTLARRYKRPPRPGPPRWLLRGLRHGARPPHRGRLLGRRDYLLAEVARTGSAVRVLRSLDVRTNVAWRLRDRKAFWCVGRTGGRILGRARVGFPGSATLRLSRRQVRTSLDTVGGRLRPHTIDLSCLVPGFFPDRSTPSDPHLGLRRAVGHLLFRASLPVQAGIGTHPGASRSSGWYSASRLW